jgi:hypothetical protein
MKIKDSKAQRTEPLAVHSAVIDTDMGLGVPGQEIAPDDLVRQAMAALEAGQPQSLADPTTHNVHAGLVAQPPVYVGV